MIRITESESTVRIRDAHPAERDGFPSDVCDEHARDYVADRAGYDRVTRVGVGQRAFFDARQS